MADAQLKIPLAAPAPKPDQEVITLPASFGFRAQDSNLTLKKESAALDPDPDTVPLGILTNFVGVFVGKGFNAIFRPNNAKGTGTNNPGEPGELANPVEGNPIPQAPNENVLELNLTEEKLQFNQALGSVPNRGLTNQVDIFLNGVPYVQSINNVTNPDTGKADRPIDKNSGIHFEPGLWMHVPKTDVNPVVGESLVRMASIPHGTTINAQCLQPTSSTAGGPTIPSVDMTPFPIPSGAPLKGIFHAQNASNVNTPRLPQDLTKFIANGTITQAILDDPNTVLRTANAGKTFVNSTTFTVATNPTAPNLGGGTANISFLEGTGGSQGPLATNASNNANAIATQMFATFWLNAVQYTVTIPVWKTGQPPVRVQPAKPNANSDVPTFVGTPPAPITTPKQIKVTTTEIQYSQLVFLNFAGLTWPHVSVATLHQSEDVPIPASAFK